MIQLNWYKIFGESHQIPDGRTVTPTDDIQIWLHCADIWDKTYTTLAEVLADTSTLVMLMAIDNAVDYLVRSTTWSGDAAVKVPTMSSDTSPEGQVIYSAQNTEDGRLGWKAFDNNDGTTWDCWQGGPLPTNQYIGYKFTSSVIVNKVSIMSEDGDRVKNFKVRGSDDGNTWTNLYSGVCPDTNPTKTLQTFSFINSTAYQYYSVFVEDIYNNDVMIGAYTIAFAYEGITTSEIAMKSIGASDYASTTLLADSTWNSAIQSSPYFEWVDNAKVPIMTSANTPSGVASAGSTRDANYPWKAFDNDDDTTWLANYPYALNTPKTEYIQYQFGYPIVVKKLYMKAYHASYNLYSDAFTLYGSNDGVTYETILTDSERNKLNNGYTAIIQNNTDQYDYHKLNITMSGNSSNTVTHPRIDTLQFYGRMTGGVQTWLRSANITDKTYTTLSEVLADSTTLSALMSNHNAVDYLVTAKGWADDICADSSAMTYIGLNNYASNTLLADATWRTAICNSTYFESVLNVKVPTMTSNTTPSGVCSAISERYPAWNAFDGDGVNTYWESTANANTSTYLQYQFAQRHKFYKASVIYYYVSASDPRLKKYKYQISDDGNTWTDVSSELTAKTVVGYNTDSTVLNANTEGQYIRLQYTLGFSNTAGIFIFQFYGREDV